VPVCMCVCVYDVCRCVCVCVRSTVMFCCVSEAGNGAMRGREPCACVYTCMMSAGVCVFVYVVL
jgi:hypothetical protein